MKATLATLACLLTAGFLTAAAEVPGNNTAVVIRKNAVISANGYQFLCVPVDPLNIAGGKGGTIALSTVLPPSTLPEDANVTGVDANEAAFTYTVKLVDEDKKWTQQNNEAVNGYEVVDPMFIGGQIFWLNTTSRTRSNPMDTVIFCGQDRELSEVVPTAKQATAMSNDSSKGLKLSAFNEHAKQGDQILTIKAGAYDYTIYRYLGGNWYGPGSENVCNDVEIAPGEAFYYYTK